MKVVALVSGGKDSCYAMMRCIDYGHEIVALANLLPLDDSVDELDSYMYQTVGHQIVVAYAECMGLPLFRRRIQGSTRHKHLDYKATTGDEVEDMYILLSEVKQKIPSISAVSSGAIASDYQRLRVESVCSRLGLVSLAYLWKKDQTLLLEEMVQRGIVAITIKVAALGLNPAKHLGKEIADLQNSLLQLNEMYGINVCGEGGEYESLTLDCPLFLNARIVIDQFQVIMHSTDPIAPVGILHPLSFHTEGKTALSSISSTNSLSGINSKSTGNVFEVQGDCVPIDVANNQTLELHPESIIMEDKVLHISMTNRNTFSLACWVPTSFSEGLQEDLEAVLRTTESQLMADGFGWANVLYIHLYISDMDAFALANEIYLRFITEKKCVLGVPSRSTIELPLAQACLGHALVEVLVANDDSKKVLHVQSMSCWAPSCIGPYSQATLHKDILYMAGQLGLDPPTMILCSGSPITQMEQALENCDAVAKSFNCCIASSAILLVTYCSVSTTPSDRVDIQCSIEGFLSQKLPGLHNVVFSTAHGPMFLYVLASDLPKRALVEIKPVLYAPKNNNVEDLTGFPEAGFAGTLPCWDFGHYTFCDLCCQKFVVDGKICSTLVSITKEMAAELCSLPDQDAAHIQHCNSNDHIRRISKFCVYILHRTLIETKFSWEDLMSLRVYFVSSFFAAFDTLNVAFLDSFNELAGFDNSIQAVNKPFFSFIPVLSVGKSSTMDDIITCEMFASKL